MKYGIAYSKTIGVFALILAILFSVFVLGGGKLASERSTVERMFYDGVQNDSLSIFNDMRTRADESYGLITIAKKYMDSDDSRIEALQKAADGVGSAGADDISALFTINNQITQAAEELSNELESYEMSTKDATLFARTLDEMDSRNSTISHDAYNSYAADFNKLLRRFPAGMIGALRGVRELDYFR